MFFSKTTNLATTAHINDATISVLPDETLLTAALRQGINFPNSCRVGGCATCKCKLTAGRVKELTESTYILSDDDMDQGYILACQSVPQTEVSIEVDLSRGRAAQQVFGAVIAQHKLTHDITRLSVQLDAPLNYKAGQFAQISVDSLPHVNRSYSFANPPQEDGCVSFFVRKVDGGIFSTHIHEQDVIGQKVTIEGPAGDFCLRDSDAPILLVAGGSGLAPILAILQDAVQNKVQRSATLLFGARSSEDLYCLDQIEEIKRHWQGEFRFVPVLSDASQVDGAERRHNLIEQIPQSLERGAHAYLCGPPAMVDSAVAVLREHGVGNDYIHADRFLTQHEGGLQPASTPTAAELNASKNKIANLFDYVKYFMFHLVGLFSAASIVAGSSAVTFGLLGVLFFYIIGDALLGDDKSVPRFTHPRILTTQLWLALPLLLLIVFCSVWTVSTGDPFGFGQFITQLTGYDVLAARAATNLGHHISALILTGLAIGLVGTITGHELTHRTWDPISMLIGRWLLAFSFDTSFAIEHVYGHHRYVSTEHDPATAPRGRNVYHHIIASTIKGNVSAWKIEARRLKRKGYALYSPHNAVLRGYLMSAVLVLAAWAIAGTVGAVFFTLCALFGKSLLEIVNYMEHYGMVRHPETPVQPRHSWNTNRRVSSWTMFNLTRHSHHHAQGEVPYHELQPYPNAPMMINGYLTTILITLVPPLWHALMTPKVLAWDRDFASKDELELAARANARSGIAGLKNADSPLVRVSS